MTYVTLCYLMSPCDVYVRRRVHNNSTVITTITHPSTAMERRIEVYRRMECLDEAIIGSQFLDSRTKPLPDVPWMTAASKDAADVQHTDHVSRQLPAHEPLGKPIVELLGETGNTAPQTPAKEQPSKSVDKLLWKIDQESPQPPTCEQPSEAIKQPPLDNTDHVPQEQLLRQPMNKPPCGPVSSYRLYKEPSHTRSSTQQNHNVNKPPHKSTNGSSYRPSAGAFEPSARARAREPSDRVLEPSTRASTHKLSVHAMEPSTRAITHESSTRAFEPSSRACVQELSGRTCSFEPSTRDPCAHAFEPSARASVRELSSRSFEPSAREFAPHAHARDPPTRECAQELSAHALELSVTEASVRARETSARELSIQASKPSTHARGSTASVFQSSATSFEPSVLPTPYKSVSEPQQTKSNRPLSRQMTRIGSGLRDRSKKRYTCHNQQTIGESQTDLGSKGNNLQFKGDQVSSPAIKTQYNAPVNEIKSQRHNMVIKDEPSELRRKRTKAKAYACTSALTSKPTRKIPVSDWILEDIETTGGATKNELDYIEEEQSRHRVYGQSSQIINNVETKTDRSEKYNPVTDEELVRKGRKKKRKKSRRRTDYDEAYSNYDRGSHSIMQSFDKYARQQIVDAISNTDINRAYNNTVQMDKTHKRRKQRIVDKVVYSDNNRAYNDTVQALEKKHKKPRHPIVDNAVDADNNPVQALEKKHKKPRHPIVDKAVDSDNNLVHALEKKHKKARHPIVDKAVDSDNNPVQTLDNKYKKPRHPIVDKAVAADNNLVQALDKKHKKPRQHVVDKADDSDNNSANNNTTQSLEKEGKKSRQTDNNTPYTIAKENTISKRGLARHKPKKHCVYDDEEKDNLRPGIWNCDVSFKQEPKVIQTLPDVKQIKTGINADTDLHITRCQGHDENFSEKNSNCCFTGIVQLFRRVFRIK